MTKINREKKLQPKSGKLKKQKSDKMEKKRQNFVLSDRDESIARSANHVAIWINDLRIGKEDLISIPKYLKNHLYGSFELDFFDMELLKANSKTRLVGSEIVKRLNEKEITVENTELDDEFVKECEKNHGLGEGKPCDVEESKQNALKCFQAFRLFYESENAEDFRGNFKENFKKSNYSIWADINLNNEVKYLYGRIDAVYWINETEKHVGIISWCMAEHIDTDKHITLETSPFFDEIPRTLLQKKECESHLFSSILETKYDLKKVTAYIVHLKNENYDIHEVDDWKKCKCVSLFEFIKP